jgi:PAS domain S-box-containing protein
MLNSDFNTNPLDLLKALANSSQILLENKIPEKSINEVLSILGNTTQVSRTYIFKNIYEEEEEEEEEELTKLQYEFEWCNTDIDPQINNVKLNQVEWNLFGNLKTDLSSGAIFNALVNDVYNQNLKEILLEQDIKSILLIPIFSNSVFWGYIGFDDCIDEKKWDNGEIITLSAIAAQLGLYIHKNELDEVLKKQNEQIKEQKLFFENIFDNLPADVVVFSTDHKYLFVNKYGIEDDEVRKWIIGKDDFDYVAFRKKPSDLAIKRRALFDKVKLEKKSVTFAESFGTGNETKHHLRYMHPVLNENNEMTYMIGYGIDITELKQKDYLLEKMMSALEKSPVGIALLDNIGNYYYMNKSHAEILEYESGELIGKHWKTIYAESEAELIEKEYFPLLIKNGSWKGITNGITKNKKTVRQEISLTSFDDGGLLCTTRDVGAVIEELEEVQKTKHQLELAMRASKLGRWTYYIETGVLDFNETIGKILDLNEFDVKLIDYEQYMNLIHEEDRKNAIKALKEHIEIFPSNKNHIFQADYRIKKSDGSYTWIMGVGKVIKNNHNNIPTEVTGFIIDIDAQKRAEEQLKQVDKRYKDLVESLNEIVFTTDLEGNFNFLNNSWAVTTGHSIEQTLQNNLSYYTHSKDKKILNELVSTLLSHQVTDIKKTLRLIDIKGKIVYLHFHATLQKDINGQIIGIVGTAENVTARIEVEKELETSKEILNKVVNSIDDVIWSIDLSTNKISFISPSIRKLVGYEPADFYSGKKSISSFVHPEYIEMLQKSNNNLKNNNIKERDIIYKLKLDDITINKFVRSQAKLVVDKNNVPIRIDGLSSDITDLVLAEQKLKDSEAKYRLISENIQDVITILDTKGNIYYISPSGSKISGFTEEEFKSNSYFEMIHPDDRKALDNFIENEIFDDNENKLIYRCKVKNGTYHWNESLVTVLEKKDGLTLLLASTRDISARIKAEEELNKALQKEKELNELKTRFVSMASHEFRTPLATIKSSSELIKLFIDNDKNLLSPLVYGKITNKIESITIDIDRITDLMTDILTMGKVAANQVIFRPSPINFPKFLTEYLEADAINSIKDRRFDYKIPANSFITNIDVQLVRQVLQNIIENAIKYSAVDTTVEITLNATESSSIITVRDYGIGISTHDLQFMFQSFFRASNVENIPGTGLGMAIVKLFIEMHGGTASIDSKINVGTTVTLKLPNIIPSN